MPIPAVALPDNLSVLEKTMKENNVMFQYIGLFGRIVVTAVITIHK